MMRFATWCARWSPWRRLARLEAQQAAAVDLLARALDAIAAADAHAGRAWVRTELEVRILRSELAKEAAERRSRATLRRCRRRERRDRVRLFARLGVVGEA